MIFERIDTWIRDRFFEPISRKVQVRTGHTCYYLAWWCMGGAFLFQCLYLNTWIMMVVDDGGIQPEWALQFWMAVVVFPCFMINCISKLYRLQKLWERASWQSVAEAESRTMLWICMRVFMISVCLVDLLVIGLGLAVAEDPVLTSSQVGSTGAWFLLTGCEYFASCTPMPPSAHKKEKQNTHETEHAHAMNRNAA